MVRNYKPKPKVKELPCRHCGKPIIVGWKTRKLPVHIECSVKALTEYQQQMREHSGPHYEHWVKRSQQFFDRVTLGSPPPLENVAPRNQD